MAGERKRCAVCGASFDPYRSTQVYCSKGCCEKAKVVRRKGRRARRRDRELAKDALIVEQARMIEDLNGKLGSYRRIACELARRQGIIDGDGHVAHREGSAAR